MRVVMVMVVRGVVRMVAMVAMVVMVVMVVMVIILRGQGLPTYTGFALGTAANGTHISRPPVL